jgi:hypothetical protein
MLGFYGASFTRGDTLRTTEKKMTENFPHGHSQVKTGLKKEPMMPSRKEMEAFVLAVLPIPSVDIRFEHYGSIILIRGLSPAGQAWLDENVGNDETQYFGNAIAAEPRYCLPIYEGAIEAGLVVG